MASSLAPKLGSVYVVDIDLKPPTVRKGVFEFLLKKRVFVWILKYFRILSFLRVLLFAGAGIV